MIMEGMFNVSTTIWVYSVANEKDGHGQNIQEIIEITSLTSLLV